ncbi:hypothetical protein XENTR_v10019368 [Xenopus tropicalis]|nr:hypothetical protein XENTR_v10019368 [Xenopus tropicalis]
MLDVKVLFAVLEDYVKEKTFDEAILDYYEHHYIWKREATDEMEDFISQYYIDNDVEHLRNMAHFIVMDAYRKQLEELETTLYSIHKVLALSEEEHEVDHILFQYEKTQQARRVSSLITVTVPKDFPRFWDQSSKPCTIASWQGRRSWKKLLKSKKRKQKNPLWWRCPGSTPGGGL